MCTHVGETVEAISDAAMILGDPARDEANAIDSPVTKLEGIISQRAGHNADPISRKLEGIEVIELTSIA